MITTTISVSESLPERRRPARLAVNQSGNRSVIVFVTVTVHERRKILANEEAHRALVSSWESAKHWHVGRYVILPDHVHFFCSPAVAEYSNVRDWVKYWKRVFGQKFRAPISGPIWQRGAWDRMLRAEESYAAKWEYVRNNPVRHGLAEDADDWPYQGELNRLEWHDR